MAVGDRDDDRAADLVKLGINRRQAIVRLATAGAGGAAAAALPSGAAAADAAAKPPRDPTDPDLVNPVVPWPRLLDAHELATTAALCDVILPADGRSPAASQVGVPAFVDEWVSAPYPAQEGDRIVIRGGLAWLNTEAARRFGRRFTDASEIQKHQICDDICSLEKAKPRFRHGARFFERMRYLTMLGFYTTLEGMKDLGYVGNVPGPEWKGPPLAVLKHFKLG
jgi:hypothetical protein